MKIALTITLGFCFAAVGRGQEPAAKTPNRNRAEASHGLHCELRVDRTEYHPGEVLILRGHVKNDTDGPLRLPFLDDPRRFRPVKLHVAAPHGETFVYAPRYSRDPDDPLRTTLTSGSASEVKPPLSPGEEQPAFRLWLRVTDDLPDWFSTKRNAFHPMSLRNTGTYRVWFEYEILQAAEAPANAWWGTALSNTVTLTVRESPPAVPPTAEQLEAVRLLQSVPPTSIDGRDFLREALFRAENEGLATHLVELCRQDVYRTIDFLRLLSDRACNHGPGGRFDRLQLGIDGAYLKTLASITLEALESATGQANPQKWFGSRYGLLEATIAYLRFHPEDEASRDRLLKLARRDAKLPPPALHGPRSREAASPAEKTPYNPLPVPAAWMVLLELEVLHPGMSVDAAIEILGPPSHRDRDRGSVGWHISSPRHVNPRLSAEVDDGKIIRFKRWRG